MKKSKHWIHLNAEGKELYGEIFLNGIIPVLSMIPAVGGIEGNPERIYLINYEEIPKKQLDKLIKLLSEFFKAPEEAIKKQMEDIGIPIRANLVSSAGTDNPGQFI